MTGAVLSFQIGTINTSESRRKRKDIEIFSESLSKYTGFDFSRIADEFNDELNGLLSYLQTRKLELESTGLSKNEVSIFLTLNMISSFSLWLGFSRAKEYPKSVKEVAEDNSRESNSSKIQGCEIKGNYKSSVVIPTNLTNLDFERLKQLKNRTCLASRIRITLSSIFYPFQQTCSSLSASMSTAVMQYTGSSVILIPIGTFL